MKCMRSEKQMGMVEQDYGCDVGKALWRTHHGFQAWETPMSVSAGYERGYGRGEKEMREGAWVTENENKQAFIYV